jgi:ABC-type transport system substrate-binding protein
MGNRASTIPGWLLIMALFAPGLGAAAEPAGEEPRAVEGAAAGGTLRIAVQDDIKGLNVFAVNDVWSSNVLYNVYDGTVNRDWKTERLQPWVAVEWCTESKQDPGACSKDDADEDVLNVTIKYQVGAWRTKFGGPVRFHDGAEVTLDDILFSYAIVPYNGRWISSVKDLLWKKSEGYDWNNPPFGDSSFLKVTVGGPGGEEGWLAIRKAGDHSLQFRLRQPYADFFQDTVSVTVMPKHVWSKHIDVQTGLGDYLQWDLDHDPSTGAAPGLIGTGPFKFGKWIQGQFSRIARNDEMFDWTRLPRVDDRGRIIHTDPQGMPLDCETANPGRCAYEPAWTQFNPNPYIDAMEFWVHLTVESGVLALQQGKVDFVGWSIPPAMVNDMIDSEKCTDLDGQRVFCREVIGLERTSDRGFFYTAFNMRRVPTGYRDFPNGDLTDDGKPLRKAIAYSTDKATIVSSLLQGYGKVALGPVSPDLRLWHNDSLPAYPLDPAKASAILDAAGWRRDASCPKLGNPPDHARRLPRLGCDPLVMLTPEAAYDPVRAIAGDMIEIAARNVGINLDSYPTAFGKIVTQITARDFDSYMLGWRIGGDPPSYLRSFFHCSEELRGNNYPGYCSEEADDLIDELDLTTNLTRRIQIVKDLQGILAEDLPYNVLYFRDSIEAFRKDRFVVPIIEPPSWIKGPAGLNFQWNWLLVQPTGKPATVTAKAPALIPCERPATLSVTMVSKGTPVEGASVRAEASYPLRFAGGSAAADAMTDSEGKTSLQFYSPKVAGKAVGWLNFSVKKEGYYPTYRNLEVEAICEGPMPPVGEATATPLRVEPGGSATVKVTVKSLADDSPVDGAKVVMEPPSLGALARLDLLTDPNGEARTVFSVPATLEVEEPTLVLLRGVPSSTTGGSDLIGPTFETEVWVVLDAGETNPPPAGPLPLTVVAVAAGAGSAAAAGAALWALRRRRKLG